MSADHDGYIKYWQPNMNNVHAYQAHREPIRALRCFSVSLWPTTTSDQRPCDVCVHVLACIMKSLSRAVSASQPTTSVGIKAPPLTRTLTEAAVMKALTFSIKQPPALPQWANEFCPRCVLSSPATHDDDMCRAQQCVGKCWRYCVQFYTEKEPVHAA